MLKELLFEEKEILEEDAGNLKQIPQAWWKAITGNNTKAGGEGSEIVEIGSDIFKKGKVRGGEAYYHKPKDKANEFMKAIDNALPKLQTYKNHRGEDAVPIAGVFVKIDGQPYAMINYQETGQKVAQKYSVVYHTGENESKSQYNTKSNFSYPRRTLTHEEFGTTLPDGKCDVYLVMTDAARVGKMAARTEARRGSASRNSDNMTKSAWSKDQGLKDLETKTEKKLIERRIGSSLDIAKSRIDTSVAQIQNQIKTAFENAMIGKEAVISTSNLLRDLENNISTVNSVLYKISSVMKSGSLRNSYNKKELSYEYKALKAAIAQLDVKLDIKK